MPRNGSGVYTLPAGNPVVTGTTISSTVQNNTMADVATELTNSLAADGQKTPTANLPMGGFKFTNLAAGSVDGESLRYQQLFSQGIETVIASATTTDIGAQRTNFLSMTLGASPVTSFGVNYNGPKYIRAAGTITFTNSATLICPNGVDLTVLSGDIFVAYPIGNPSNGWAIVGTKINFAKGADIASASTVNLSTATGNTVNLTGTTAVTAWTMYTGQRIRVNFTAATPITYNAVTNQIQGGSSITGEVGSYLDIYYDGTTTFVTYILNNGASASGPSFTTVPAVITTTGATLTANAVGVPTKVNSATATTTTLPAVSTLILGQSLTLVNIGAGVATFIRAGSDTITGGNLSAATSISLNQGETVTLTCDSASTLLVTYSNVKYFGAQQVWQNLTASRAVGTTYTNTSGAEINIAITVTYPGSGQLGSLTVNGVLVANTPSTGGAGYFTSVAAPVPNGATYVFNNVSGAATLTNWAEKR